MFPLADARGRIVGFQARKLHEDDPLQGKYVNSPEGELFHKSAILYGLHLARTAIAKQERAVVVEGNTDVIALRQAGFEPVVASMGTALTERQLKELQRLTRRLYLCFDSDAAGEEATLRGMELATSLGFDVRVVTLPKGQDPADAPDGFEERLGGAESYVVYRVRLELDRTPDRQEAFVRAREILQRNEDSPEWQDALRLLAGRLDLPEGDARRPDAEGRRADARPRSSRRRCSRMGERLERTRLRRASPIRRSSSCSPSSRPSTSTSELHRRFRAQLVDGGATDERPARAPRRSSTRAPRGRGSTSGPARSCCSTCASGGCGGSSRTPSSDQHEGAPEALARVRAAIDELSVERA